MAAKCSASARGFRVFPLILFNMFIFRWCISMESLPQTNITMTTMDTAIRTQPLIIDWLQRAWLHATFRHVARSSFYGFHFSFFERNDNQRSFVSWMKYIKSPGDCQILKVEMKPLKWTLRKKTLPDLPFLVSFPNGRPDDVLEELNFELRVLYSFFVFHTWLFSQSNTDDQKTHQRS